MTARKFMAFDEAHGASDSYQSISSAPTPSPGVVSQSSPAIDFWTVDLLGVVQIAFWITLAVIAVLTFLQARRTLLQPLRTEVYKLQIAAIKDLLAILVGKDEVSLTRHFDLDGILKANAVRLLDDYARAELGAPVENAENRPYSRKFCPGGLIELPSDEIVELVGFKSAEKSKSDSGKPEADWKEHRVTMLHLTHRYYEATGELQTFLADPLIPVALAERIQNLLDGVHKDVSAMFSVLNESSLALPALFPSTESLKSVQMGGFQNDWNRQRPSLQPLSEEIITFTRHYFQSDGFMSGSSKL